MLISFNFKKNKNRRQLAILTLTSLFLFGGFFLASAKVINFGTPTDSIYVQGNLGVGTSQPAGLLDVEGASSILLGGSDATFRLTSTLNTLWMQGWNAARTGTVNNIAFSGYGGANRTMDIDLANQRVGIGTTNPDVNLHVYDSGTNAVVGVEQSAGNYALLNAGGTNASFRFNESYNFTIDKTSSIIDVTPNFKFLDANGSTNNLSFNEGSMFIRGDNSNIGINNTNPTTKLDVSGTFRNTLQTTHGMLGSAGNVLVAADNTGNLYQSNITEITSATKFTGGMIYDRKAVSDANYIIQSDDYIIGFTSLSADRTLTLPNSLCVNGRAFIITNETSGSHNVVVDPESTTQISGQDTITLGSYNSVPVYCNGSNWFIY